MSTFNTPSALRLPSAVTEVVSSRAVKSFVVSPAFGRVVELYGYAPLMFVAAVTPLAACAALRRSVR